MPQPAQLTNTQDIMPATTLVEMQVHSLFSSIPLSLAVTIALDLILSISHWSIIGHGELIFWNILVIGTICLRLAFWYAWRNSITSNNLYWLRLFRGGVWLSGAAWGSSAFFMFANFNPAYQALLAFTLAGMTSGSLTTLAVDKHSAIVFVALIVCPLSLRLLMENGPIATPMAIMSVLYILFVLSASTRARRALEEQHDKNTRLIAWGKEREKYQQLNKIINQAQTQFINKHDSNAIFESFLKDILVLTDSKFGFISNVSYNTKNQPELSLRTICSITPNKQLDAFYQQHVHKNSTLTNMDNLLGAVITKGKAIISNAPSKDIRSGGLPAEHPTLSSFLGIPLFSGSTQIALFGIANNPQGYSESMVTFLKPISNTITQFLEAINNSKQQQIYEEKLHNNAKQTQTILDEVFDAIITIEKDGKIKSFNHAAETIFGYNCEEIINQSIHLLISNLQQTTNANFTFNMGQELVGVRRNGKTFPIELSTSEIVMDDMPITIGVVRDISERKHNDELKTQFISTVSHELRTPLTSIAGALGILNSGSLGKHTDQQQKLITIALHNSLRLQCLINDLLDMDKLLANKMELNIYPYCILEAVSKAIDNNQLYAKQHHVKLILAHSPKTTLVLGDPHRIQQVLTNLISNAAKFSNATSTSNSTVEIGIAVTGDFAQVTVTDHGNGIPEDFKSKIFQRFSQADSSDTRQKGGSGLGLAISKELIQRMGGNINFTSTPGKGCCFYFELPLAEKTTHS